MISLLIYQATDVALYYVVGFTIYLWAYTCGEEIPLKWWQTDGGENDGECNGVYMTSIAVRQG
jgi:hypothetical protein